MWAYRPTLPGRFELPPLDYKSKYQPSTQPYLRCKPATSKSGELSIAGVFSALPDYATATLLGKEIGRALRFFTSVCVTSRTMESNHEDRSISTLCNLPRCSLSHSDGRACGVRKRGRPNARSRTGSSLLGVNEVTNLCATHREGQLSLVI